ncbi:hypothetical protein HK101_007668 [Irineochytrium annulatum]|nr:hypothetical protein HK101_007668 [Irineochytrium annulatum]
MSEIEEFDEQMLDLLDGIRHVLDNEISKMKGQERIEKCSYLRNRLARAKQVHRSILVEIRDLPAEKAPDWETKAKDYETTIGKLLQDVDWAETTAKGDEVKRKPVEELTAKETTQMAMQVQEQTLQSTSRAKQIVEETIQIGAAVNEELKKQGEQIHAIAEGVEQVESNLTRADKQLRVFMRRMATDKIFLLFIFLIVLGIIIALVLYILKQKGYVKL